MLLELKNISVEFNGFKALNNVSLSVKKNSVHGIVGPNGAGKTTCFKAISGNTKYTGDIIFNGESIKKDSPASIARKKLLRSFQVPSLFPSLTLSEHFHLMNTQSILHTITSEFELNEYKDKQISELPHGTRRICELALLQSLSPQLLILDEPSSGIGAQDFNFLMTKLKHLANTTTLLIIEHDMRFIESLCDTVSILNRGELLAEGTFQEISQNQTVKNIYLGNED